MSNKVITKISSALRSGDISRHPRADANPLSGRLIPEKMTDSDKIALLKERGAFSGSSIYVVDSIASAAEEIAKIAPANSNISVTETADLKKRLACPISNLLPESAKHIATDQLKKSDDTLFDLNVAITGVHTAIAETGSIILTPDAELSRLTSLVAEIHIALIWPDQIVPDILDFTNNIQNLKDESKTSYTMISGPSKTADIEMKLVIGVHGPKQLHLIIINN